VPSARELLEQADALMRRNRAGMIDTEIPELRDIAIVALAPAAAPLALDDVPELTEAVEEIEIESIVELPEDIDESSGWLHHDHGDLGVVGKVPDSAQAATPVADAAVVERAPSAFTIVSKGPDLALPAPVEKPVIAASPAAALPDAVLPPVADSPPAAHDEWARWEVLADEIRMQVLQRIDIFTDTGLRDQLSAQLQPIVDRASAEMVSTINEHVGGLLRAYIAEAIEREIEKWRAASR
jgi:hypothetical protein